MSVRHDERPIKWCHACETHFKALPNVHADAEHDGIDMAYTRGTWKDAERKSQFRVDETVY
jgi:hypothetical protein